jgi:hypothetical protein
VLEKIKYTISMDVNMFLSFVSENPCTDELVKISLLQAMEAHRVARG